MKKILITGAHGFLGNAVSSEFLSNNYYDAPNSNISACGVLYRPTHLMLDILAYQDLLDYCKNRHITDIIHLAASCGGIGLNQMQPADLMLKNLEMGLNVLKVARALKLNKTVLISTVCSYPKFATVPFSEEAIWDGFPEETNSGYGIAKKTLMLAGDMLRQQDGLNVITLIPTNMAGEWDHFDPQKSHVIPALIVKFAEAKKANKPSVVLWGTGEVTREFIYSGDVATAIRLAFEQYNGNLPINIGTGQEIKIKDLAEKIARKLGYEGIIEWDASKPNGQPRRCLDTSRAKNLLGFEAHASLDKILDRTIDAYLRGQVIL